MTDFKPNTKLDRPGFLIRVKSLQDILSDLRKAEAWLLVAATAAFLASAFFVVKYFVGGEMTPETWTSEQWLNAFLGLGITAVITAAQAFLYASGYKGYAAIIATFIVVFFGLFSEIAQSMEREDASVRMRSENSAVFQAALGSINHLASQAQQVSPEQKLLADAESHLAYWHALKEQKQESHRAVKYSFRTIERNIVEYQKQVNSFRQQVNMQSQHRSNMLSSAIQQAKELEYDEDKHYAMIRLLKSLFGVTGIWASFMFSMIIIGTFEYAFHFVGGYVADHKRALLLLGRDAQGRRLQKVSEEVDGFEEQSRAADVYENHGHSERPGWSSADSQTGNQTDNYDFKTDDANANGGRKAHAGGIVHDLTQKRFFKLMHTEIRNRVLNKEITPTVRPVTEAVNHIIREKSHLLGIDPAVMGKPQRQKIAQTILEQLEKENVVQLNSEGGVGKPKYVLSAKYMHAS